MASEEKEVDIQDSAGQAMERSAPEEVISETKIEGPDQSIENEFYKSGDKEEEVTCEVSVEATTSGDDVGIKTATSDDEKKEKEVTEGVVDDTKVAPNENVEVEVETKATDDEKKDEAKDDEVVEGVVEEAKAIGDEKQDVGETKNDETKDVADVEGAKATGHENKEVSEEVISEADETGDKNEELVEVVADGGVTTDNVADVEATKNLVNPMLDDMEKTVEKSTAILDKFNEELEQDRQKRFKKIVQSHIPEELMGEGKKEEEVMKLVDQLLFYEECEENEEEVQLNEDAHLSELDETAKLTVTAHSLAAHFTTLESNALARASAKVWSDCRLWLSRLFRFKDSMPVYHDKRFEGLARICQLALYQKYPKYATEGFEALYSRPPVIYISAVAPPGLSQYLCQQLGLPFSCVSTVPCNTMFGASSKMDVEMLEKLIQDDISAAKTPVLLVAYAGTPIVGHVDNIEKLQEITKANNIWLHVEGNNLATLTMFSVPSSVESALSGDSLTLDLSCWLGVPSLPYITLFKDSDATLTEAAGLTSVDSKLQLKCLPLWMCLQSLGHEGMVSRIKESCDLAKALFDQLDKLTTIKQISREKKQQEKQPKNVTDLIFKAINALLVFEIVTPTVVFKYCEDTTSPGAVVAPYANINVEEGQEKDAVYFDALNTWLAEALVMANPRVPIDLVEVDKEGVCIRYAPLETAQVRGTNAEDIEKFVESLNTNLGVLNATTMQRKKFQTIVGANSNLKLVDLDSWAGLGAISYIPEDHVAASEYDEKAKEDINKLNDELVQKLKAQDTAFSSGNTADGLVCVRFGLITSDTDVEELVSLVHSIGKEVEESSKFLETMTEVIKKGIEEANKELEKESTEKLMHEGVLRQVPVVSSLLNWFSPSKEDIKGRTFNLKSGKIKETTDTYKYHMQIQEEKPPAEPLKVPVKENLDVPVANGEVVSEVETSVAETEETTAGDTTAEETTAGDTTAEETAAGDTKAEETKTEETAAEETTADEATTDEPAAEEPATEKTTTDETTPDENTPAETITETSAPATDTTETENTTETTENPVSTSESSLPLPDVVASEESPKTEPEAAS